MVDRYIVSVPRPRPNGTTYWHIIGSAFPARSGDGMDIILDSLPTPNEKGEVRLIVRTPSERDQPRRPQQPQQPQQPAQQQPRLGDDDAPPW